MDRESIRRRERKKRERERERERERDKKNKKGKKEIVTLRERVSFKCTEIQR